MGIAVRNARYAPALACAVALFGALSLSAPLQISPHYVLARTLAGYAAIGCVLRVIDIARAPATFSALERIAIVLLMVDPREVRRIPRELQIGRWILGIALGLAGAALLAAAHRLYDGAPAYGSIRQYARSLVGGVAVLLVAESSQRVCESTAAGFGYAIPDLHRAPSHSRSLAEFWGQRWNRFVGGWLREHCYSPLARARRPRAGMWAAFVVSAFIHVYPTAISVGAAAAASIGAFFLIHGALVIFEPHRRLRRWSKLSQRAYVIAVFAVTTPLFCEPFLRSIAL